MLRNSTVTLLMFAGMVFAQKADTKIDQAIAKPEPLYDADILLLENNSLRAQIAQLSQELAARRICDRAGVPFNVCDISIDEKVVKRRTPPATPKP